MYLNLFEIINGLCYIFFIIVIIFYSYKLNNFSEPVHTNTKYLYSFILSLFIIIPVLSNSYLLYKKNLSINYKRLVQLQIIILSPIMFAINYYKDEIVTTNFDSIYTSSDLIDTIEYDNRGNQITIKKNDLKYKIRKQAAESEYHIRSEMGRGIYE